MTQSFYLFPIGAQIIFRKMTICSICEQRTVMKIEIDIFDSENVKRPICELPCGKREIWRFKQKTTKELPCLNHNKLRFTNNYTINKNPTDKLTALVLRFHLRDIDK